MFCSKCGNELKTDAVFCNKCGARVEASNSEPEMSLAESITFVETLKAKYSALEKLEHEVSDNEAIIARPVVQTAGQFSFFRFFWKYLIYAVVAFFGMDLITLASYKNITAVYIFFALMFILPIGILIFGSIKAANQREAENRYILINNDKAIQQRKELEAKTSSLKLKLTDMRRELEPLELSVPTDLRKTSSMNQILTLLKTKKASSLNEAYRILKK